MKHFEKEYFNKFKSNTLASSGNQSYFASDNTLQRGRAFYKVFAGGEYEYSFLFTNIIDSTFSDGSHSQANLMCEKWMINKIDVLIVDKKETNFANPKVKNKYSLTFNGEASKAVEIGDVFYSDKIGLNCEKGDYICLEIAFTGMQIPYFEELIIPSYRFIDGEWKQSKQTPLSCMVGCDRKSEKTIAFFGDSITEGCGTPMNSYSQWNAQIASIVGEKYSYWNIGIGFGRANDAGSLGIWLEKAKNADVVTVCFGVNDICQGFSAESIKNNLKKIILSLKEAGVRTILFTVPPFDFTDEKREKWYEVNDYITNELSKITEIYDTRKVLCDDAPNDNIAKYDGHPSPEGCLELAKDFVKNIEL